MKTTAITITVALFVLNSTAAVLPNHDASKGVIQFGQQPKVKVHRTYHGSGNTQEEARADAENQASRGLPNGYRVTQVSFSGNSGRYYCSLDVEFDYE
jgi:hypothetical protein